MKQLLSAVDIPYEFKTPAWQTHQFMPGKWSKKKKSFFYSLAPYNSHLFFTRNVVVSVTIQSAAHSPHAV